MLKEGDYIFLYHEKASYMIPYQKNGSFSSHKGNVKFEGELDYGDRLVSNIGEEFYILKPTLADYMMKVKRRTTIIYPKEAGVIALEMGVLLGKRVLEIGTGSGSLTILLSNMVGENGRVYSFERKEEHQENAKKNMKRFNFGGNVEYFLMDPVIEKGFGLTELDAMFIDVPAPWTLVQYAHKALSLGAHIGFLSPNIEQIQTTVEALRTIGFARIRCIETLARGIRIKKNLTRPYDRMVGHTGYLLFAQKVKTSDQASFGEYVI
jgi:tRNA (adenine57-N1/adenine58-N1)-methyltransferase catalytic subunit